MSARHGVLTSGPLSSEECRDRLDGFIAAYAEHGFGKWAVVAEASGEVVGYCGVELTAIDGPPVPELGFRFRAEIWGQGYAAEAAHAALDHCFREHGFSHLVAFVEPANHRSVRVITKLGFTFQRSSHWLGHAVHIYQISNEIAATPMTETIQYRDSRDFDIESVVALYRANDWSSAEKPDLLHRALLGSHSLFTAWHGESLVGLGNAISDSHLVVYYPHLLVHPDYQGRGIGTELMRRLVARYEGFHQHMLTADGRALDFYRKLGFERAGRTEPMWIYAGHDH